MRAGRTVATHADGGDRRPADLRARWSGATWRSPSAGTRDGERRAALASIVAARRCAISRVKKRDGTHRARIGVSLDRARGEILGIAGVEGNGQTELIEAIAGLACRPTAAATSGCSARHHRRRCARAVDAGLSHMPEDRHGRGLVLDYSVADNLILGQQHHFTQSGMLDARRDSSERGDARSRTFDIRPPARQSLPARALSGGNQQKIVIAREMGRDFTVLLAAQPTRGVDVGAIEFIHDALPKRAARQGRAARLGRPRRSARAVRPHRRDVSAARGRGDALARARPTPKTLGAYMTGATRESA